jgi:hypothetical protein
VGRLGPPLALLLQSARWYTYSVASRYRALLTENFQALRADGRSEVDYVRFWDRVAPNFGDRGAETPAIVKEVSLELRRHWSELLLGADAGEKRVQRRSSELHDRVMELFRAPHPGWPAARHHSPDIMVAAAGPDAARRGEYLLVLGELHVAVNGLLTPMALIHQADPSELLRARDLDFPEPSISPVEATAQATRVDNFSLAARDVHVELASGKSWRPKAQVIGVNELVVAEVDGKLVVRTRDGRQSFDIINFFAPYLTYASFGHFALIAPAKHSPRVTIDDLVVRREQWQFTPQELDFAAVEGGADRFLGLREGPRRAEALLCRLLEPALCRAVREARAEGVGGRGHRDAAGDRRSVGHRRGGASSYQRAADQRRRSRSLAPALNAVEQARLGSIGHP